MNKLLKTLRRTIVIEGYVNKLGRRALQEIAEAYRAMLQEMVEYAVEHRVSQSTLHRVFYHEFRQLYPWLPTRVIKGAYRDSFRRAKSFRELKKRGLAKTEKPEVKKVTLTYSDMQDWKLENGVMKLRTHQGWILIHFRNHKQLHRYLYGGWRLSQELRLKVFGRRVKLYLTFEKDFEVSCEYGNVVAVDINENNVTVALFRSNRLVAVYRVETGLGRIVIAYSERRKGICEGRSTKDRSVRRGLRGLRERDRKHDILRKVARFIETLARENRAVVVVGNISSRAKERMREGKNKRLRHRIHQWGALTLIRLLEDKPMHVVRVSEKGSSSIDPFTGTKIPRYGSLVIRYAVRGASRVRVLKVVLRVVRMGGRIFERDVVGAINIGLRYLSSDGSLVALGSTELHEARVKLVIPGRGLTQLMELKIPINI